MIDKFQVYEGFGVKEYWIILLHEMDVYRYVLDSDGKFRPFRLLTLWDTLTSSILPEFEIAVEDIFETDLLHLF